MRRTLTLALASTALLAAAPAAHAATYTVKGGKLDWTQANQLTSFSDPAATFLGYITSSFSAGAVTSSDGATMAGPSGAVTTIDASSARGTDQLYTLTYPGAAGTISDEGVGAVELTGTVTWTTHGLPITVTNPQLTLNGLTGTLAASGAAADMRGNPFTYDRAKPQFTLDLSKAAVTLRADGSRVITGIVPANTAESVLGGFGTGATRYGTMNLTLGLAYPTTQGAVNGKDGATGPAGKDGRDATFKVIRLAKAPFATAAEVHVKLLDRKTGKTLATGTVQRRALRLGVLSGTRLKGGYTLKRTASKASGKRQATITIK